MSVLVSLDVSNGEVSLRVRLPARGSSGIAGWVAGGGRSAVGGDVGPEAGLPYWDIRQGWTVFGMVGGADSKE